MHSEPALKGTIADVAQLPLLTAHLKQEASELMPPALVVCALARPQRSAQRAQAPASPSIAAIRIPSDRKSKQQWLTFEQGLLACIRVGCCLHLRGTTSARRDAHEDDMQIVTPLDAQRTATQHRHLMRILLMTR